MSAIQEAKETLARWYDDDDDFTKSCLRVIDKHNNAVPFIPNWAQRRIRKFRYWRRRWKKPARLIVDKDRKAWVSTEILKEIYKNHIFFPNSNCLVLGNEWTTAEEMRQKLNVFEENLPSFLYPLLGIAGPSKTHGINNNKQITVYRSDPKNPRNRINPSIIKFATANNLRTGLGMSPVIVHATEVAQYGANEKLFRNFIESVHKTPETFIVFESVAEGFGNIFEQYWTKSYALALELMEKYELKGDDEYDFTPLVVQNLWPDLAFFPMFFSAQMNPDNRLPLPVGVEKYRGELTKEEKEIVSLYLMDRDEERRYEFVEYRRQVLEHQFNGDINGYKIQHPMTPEESFRTSSKSVFDQNVVDIHLKQGQNLRKTGKINRYRLEWAKGFEPQFDPMMGIVSDMFKPKVEAVHDEEGCWEIFMHPGQELADGKIIPSKRDFENRYVMGSDHGEGHSYSNYDTAYVMDEHQDMFVAQLRGRLGPERMAEEMWKGAVYYQYASMYPSRRGPGQSSISLLTMRYPYVLKTQHYSKGVLETKDKYGHDETSQSNRAMNFELDMYIKKNPEGMPFPDFWTDAKTYVTKGKNANGDEIREAEGKSSNPGKEDANQDDCVDASGVTLLARKTKPLMMENVSISKEIRGMMNKKILKPSPRAS